MSADPAPISQAQKIKALRQIQYLIGQGQQPLALACGLTEAMFLQLCDDELIEVTHFRDEGPTLEIHRIHKILPKGDALLAQAYVAPSPSQVTLVEPHRTISQHVGRWTGKTLLEFLKGAAYAGGGFLAGWFAAKYHLKQ